MQVPRLKGISAVYSVYSSGESGDPCNARYHGCAGGSTELSPGGTGGGLDWESCGEESQKRVCDGGGVDENLMPSRT